MEERDLVREIEQNVEWVTSLQQRLSGDRTYVFDALDIELNVPVLLKVDQHHEIWVNFEEQWMPCGYLVPQ